MSAVKVVSKVLWELVSNVTLFAVACLAGAFLVPGLCLLRLVSSVINVLWGRRVVIGADQLVVVIGAGTHDGVRLVRGLAATGCAVLACDSQPHTLYGTFKKERNVQVLLHSMHGDLNSGIINAVRSSGKQLYAVVVVHQSLSHLGLHAMSSAYRGGGGASRLSPPDVATRTATEWLLAAPPIAGRTALSALSFHCSEDSLRSRLEPSLFSTIRVARELLPLLVAASTIAQNSRKWWWVPSSPTRSASEQQKLVVADPRLVVVRPDAAREDQLAQLLLCRSGTNASSGAGGSGADLVSPAAVDARGGAEATNRLMGEALVTAMETGLLGDLRTRFGHQVRIVEVKLHGCDDGAILRGHRGEVHVAEERTPAGEDVTMADDVDGGGKRSDALLEVLLKPNPRDVYIVPAAGTTWGAMCTLRRIAHSAKRVNAALTPTALGLRRSIDAALSSI